MVQIHSPITAEYDIDGIPQRAIGVNSGGSGYDHKGFAMTPPSDAKFAYSPGSTKPQLSTHMKHSVPSNSQDRATKKTKIAWVQNGSPAVENLKAENATAVAST